MTLSFDMNWKLLLIFSLLPFFVQGQSQVQGSIFDQNSRKSVAKVDVFNLSNKSLTQSNEKGEFIINAKLNDVLIFSMPGYRNDTLLLINLKPLKRYLFPDENLLHTVTITNKATLKKQYADVFNKANPILLKQGRGLLFYPSAMFGREGKNARRAKRWLINEEKEKQIDRRYNVKSITAILPLKQPELDAFIAMYRPTLKFIQRASADDLKFYLLDAYKKFNLLPPEQKRITPIRVDENIH